MARENFDLIIYYDGLCHLCSREINHYRKMRSASRIYFQDITHPEFNAEKAGLDPFEVHQVMHVQDQEGRIFKGVDAFLKIWEVLPEYRWLRKIVGNPVTRPLVDLAYAVFAKHVRPRLPKRKKLCEDSPYCEFHVHSTNSTGGKFS